MFNLAQASRSLFDRSVKSIFLLVLGGACSPPPVIIEGLPCADYEGDWRDKARSHLGMTKDHFYDAIADRFASVENAIIRRCNDDHWSPEFIRCRPGQPCAADLTDTQRKALDADLVNSVAGLKRPAATDSCSRAFASFVWHHSKGQAVGPMIWVQAVAPSAAETLISSCRDDHWSTAAIDCFGKVKDPASWDKCGEQLDAEQRMNADARFKTELMRVVAADEPLYVPF